VRDLDGFRAPLGEAEIARRRGAGLTPAQEACLRDWGYPYVMDHFRFHITLTGKLPRTAHGPTRAVLERALRPLLPTPFVIDGLSLAGEDTAGRFHLLHRYPFSG